MSLFEKKNRCVVWDLGEKEVELVPTLLKRTKGP